jgi:hypothetical protein
MEDPPIELLVVLLRPMRSDMPREIQHAYDELAERAPALVEAKADHRFLMAVNAVARNASLFAGSTSASSSNSVTLLLYDYAEIVELAVASTDEEPFDRALAVPDDFQPPEWPFRVASIGDSASVVETLLSPHSRSPLTWVLRPGVVPFVTAEHGVPELLKRGRIEETSYLLVRSDRLEAVRSLYGIEDRRVRASGIDGWSIIRDPNLRQSAPAELAANGLGDVPVLHPRPVRNTLRLRDGYAVLGDFLGFRSTTPWISAPGAVRVSASLDGTSLELNATQGRWILPDRDLFGLLEVLAEYPHGGPLRKSARLIAEPVDLDYKCPTKPSEWMQETLAGTSMYSDAQVVNSSPEEEEIADGVHSVYLGPVVGEFLPSSEGAVYELTSFGDIRYAKLLDPAGAEPPTRRVAEKGMCRRWRQSLDDYVGSADDDATRTAMRRAKQATDLKTLEVVISERGHRPSLDRAPVPHLSCRVVQAAIGSYSTRRAGMSIREWNRLLETAFSLSYDKRRLVHRAWVEAGLIDELHRTRWQGTAIFARRPVLMTFRVGSARFGSIDGLVMPTRLAHLQEIASTLGLSTSLNRSPSPFLPARLMVRSSDPDRLDEFAARAGLKVTFLASGPSLDVPRRDVEFTELRMGYTTRRSFPTFTPPDGTVITMHQRSDAPQFWSAEIGSRRVWSYSPEAVSFWILRARSAGATRIGQGSELEASLAFLPLSIARWLSVVSGTNPGPRPSGCYVNSAPSRHLAERVFGLVEVLSSDQIKSGAESD